MNLNNNPTTKQLASLVAQCNDNSNSHILWASKSGDVIISPLDDSLSPIGFQEATPSMAMRYETFQMGNDYVGVNASKDIEHINRLFNDLVINWKKYTGNGVIYID